MTFPPTDPRRFILESIPDRFGKLKPEEFADFVKYLFQLDGYEAQPSINSPELGPHVRVRKEDSTLVILPLLMPADVLIEKEHISTAIKARDLYQVEQAWVITTSGFTTESKNYASHEDVEMWDWNALYDGICQLFFEGKSHLEFIPPVQTTHPSIADHPSELKLKVKWDAQEGVGKNWYNLQLSISNPTSRNIYVHLELPALIDLKKNQIAADQWREEEFVSGLIYAGATIRTNVMFKVSKVGERPSGGKVVMTYHERNDVPTTHHLSAKLKGEACYFVTYCYGRESQEYAAMVAYREQRLKPHFFGRLLITFYYSCSPLLIRFGMKSKLIDRLIHTLTKIALRKFSN